MPRSTMTAESIDQILQAVDFGITYNEIARSHRVGKSTICKVVADPAAYRKLYASKRVVHGRRAALSPAIVDVCRRECRGADDLPRLASTFAVSVSVVRAAVTGKGVYAHIGTETPRPVGRCRIIDETPLMTEVAELVSRGTDPQMLVEFVRSRTTPAQLRRAQRSTAL